MSPEQHLQRLDEARSQKDSWTEWYRMTPLERWEQSKKLWQFYLQVGGSLDPDQRYWRPLIKELESMPLATRKGR
ncbi:MAG: hypothetical protein AAF670_09015 [Planctomycetota bacterium]